MMLLRRSSEESSRSAFSLRGAWCFFALQALCLAISTWHEARAEFESSDICIHLLISLRGQELNQPSNDNVHAAGNAATIRARIEGLSTYRNPQPGSYDAQGRQIAEELYSIYRDNLGTSVAFDALAGLARFALHNDVSLSNHVKSGLPYQLIWEFGQQISWPDFAPEDLARLRDSISLLLSIRSPIRDYQPRLVAEFLRNRRFPDEFRIEIMLKKTMELSTAVGNDVLLSAIEAIALDPAETNTMRLAAATSLGFGDIHELRRSRAAIDVLLSKSGGRARNERPTAAANDFLSDFLRMPLRLANPAEQLRALASFFHDSHLAPPRAQHLVLQILGRFATEHRVLESRKQAIGIILSVAKNSRLQELVSRRAKALLEEALDRGSDYLVLSEILLQYKELPKPLVKKAMALASRVIAVLSRTPESVGTDRSRLVVIQSLVSMINRDKSF